MIHKSDELMEAFSNLEDLLNEYNVFTNMLMTVDLENTDLTDSILSDRDGIINQLKKLHPRITNIINSMDNRDSSTIRNMLSGKMSASAFSLSEYEKDLHSKIIDLRSIQMEVSKKDKENASRFKAKRDDVRAELEKLQKDKKKINFYNNASLHTKGQDYDMHN